MSESAKGGPTAGGVATTTPGVVACDPASDPRWDRFVGDHPDGSAYHTAGWFEVVHRLHGYDPTALACEDASGRLLGVLPLVRKRAGLISKQKYYSSLPQTP